MVLTATVGPGLMSSRPHFNETSAPPKITLSHSPLNPPTGSSEQCVAKRGVSQPTGTGPRDPHLGSSVCMCVCLWAAEWSLSSLKSQPIHLRPPLAAEKLTNYHFFPLPSVFFFQPESGGMYHFPDLSRLRWCKSLNNYTRTHIGAIFGGLLPLAAPALSWNRQ